MKQEDKIFKPVHITMAWPTDFPVDMVGAAGFEPTITGSKPDALPLGYAPM